MTKRIGELPADPTPGETGIIETERAGVSYRWSMGQLRSVITSAWQGFIGTFLAAGNTAAARSAIGAQTADADLDAIAALAVTGLLARTGAGTAAARTITGTSNKVAVSNGNGASGNPTLTLPDALALVTPTVSGLLDLQSGQLKFPAAQNPSADPNTLDDYEEGTWTPSITFSTPGDLAITYSVRQGFYRKIGSMVQWSAIITTSAFTHTTAAGALLISGLPFAAVSNPPVCFARWVGVTSAVATPQVSAILNSSNIQFEVMNIGAGTTASLTTANAPTNVQKQIYVGGTYHV